MKYRSTRGGAIVKDFEDVLLSSYALDGGLYVPVELPAIGDKLQEWATFNFPEVCAEVLHLFTGIEIKELRKMTASSYSLFNDGNDPLPITSIGDLYLLDASLGPSLAFKDIGQQMIGKLLDYYLKRSNKFANIMIETSGDTGPAAIAAIKECSHVNIFCLYPNHRVSEVQELQMITQSADNVTVYRTDGNTDEQASVLKELFNDQAFVEQYNICSVNSINWARIAIQSSYYVWAYIHLRYQREEISGEVNFIVPSGAFGNAMGGFIAKLMGTPIHHIICATNVNDIVHRTIANGDLRLSQNQQTESPAMDIQFSYNLERMIYFASGGDGAKVTTLMTQIDKQYAQLTIEEGVQLDEHLLEEIQKHFLSCRITDVETLQVIQEVYETYSMVICPHSAVGIAAGMHYYSHECQAHPTISILTAHPAKFAATIEKALQFVPEAIMKRVLPLYSLPRHYEVLTKDELMGGGGTQWREEWVKILKQAVITKAKK